MAVWTVTRRNTGGYTNGRDGVNEDNFAVQINLPSGYTGSISFTKDGATGPEQTYNITGSSITQIKILLPGPAATNYTWRGNATNTTTGQGQPQESAVLAVPEFVANEAPTLYNYVQPDIGCTVARLSNTSTTVRISWTNTFGKIRSGETGDSMEDCTYTVQTAAVGGSTWSDLTSINCDNENGALQGVPHSYDATLQLDQTKQYRVKAVFKNPTYIGLGTPPVTQPTTPITNTVYYGTTTVAVGSAGTIPVGSAYLDSFKGTRDTTAPSQIKLEWQAQGWKGRVTFTLYRVDGSTEIQLTQQVKDFGAADHFQAYQFNDTATYETQTYRLKVQHTDYGSVDAGLITCDRPVLSKAPLESWSWVDTTPNMQFAWWFGTNEPANSDTQTLTSGGSTAIGAKVAFAGLRVYNTYQVNLKAIQFEMDLNSGAEGTPFKNPTNPPETWPIKKTLFLNLADISVSTPDADGFVTIALLTDTGSGEVGFRKGPLGSFDLEANTQGRYVNKVVTCTIMRSTPESLLEPVIAGNSSKSEAKTFDVIVGPTNKPLPRTKNATQDTIETLEEEKKLVTVYWENPTPDSATHVIVSRILEVDIADPTKYLELARIGTSDSAPARQYEDWFKDQPGRGGTLEQGTAYVYKIDGWNQNAAAANQLNDNPLTFSHTTGTYTAATPDPVTDLGASLNSLHLVVLNWKAPLTGDDARAYTIKRKLSGGTYSVVASDVRLIPAYDGWFTWIDPTRLTEGETYTYQVIAVAEVAATDNPEVSITITPRPRTYQLTSPHTFTPGARTSIVTMGPNTFYLSDLDRAIVSRNGLSYPIGLLPHRDAPTLEAVARGGTTAARCLLDGTYKVFVKLIRKTGARSNDGPESDEIQVAGGEQFLRVTAPNDSTTVDCRDTAYDLFGISRPAADAWEIYVEKVNADWAAPQFYGSYPMTTLSVDLLDVTDADLLDQITRRPMELLGQGTIPPACAFGEPYGSRLVIGGERRQIAPPATAKIILTRATRTFYVSGFALTTGLLQKQLYVNGRATGWFVSDVISTTQGELQHPDPIVNASGYDGIDWDDSGFDFRASGMVIYFSALYVGEANGGLTYNPEGFPPLNRIESQLEPDDNFNPVALIKSRDALYIGKPNKWIVLTGGKRTDEEFWLDAETTVISRSSGTVSQRTCALDDLDNIYCLSDHGPVRVSQASVEPIGSMFGNPWIFQNWFRSDSLKNAVAVWDPRDSYYIVFGVDRKGWTGGRDGFILDTKTGHVRPFRTSQRITAAICAPESGGTYQVIIGDDLARVGVFLHNDIYVDNYDMRGNGAISPFPFSVKSGRIRMANDFRPAWFQASCVSRYGTRLDNSQPLTVRVISDERMGDTIPTAVVEGTFNSAQTHDMIRLDRIRCQTAQIELSGIAQVNGGLEFSELTVMFYELAAGEQ